MSYTIDIPADTTITFYGPVAVDLVNRETGEVFGTASIAEAGYPLFISGNPKFQYVIHSI